MQKAANRVARVVYHCPCPDGAYAALAAHLYFNKSGTDVAYIPHSTFKKLAIDDNPNFHPDTDVFLLDYIGPSDFVPRLAPKVKSITLIDHHKTAFELIDEWKAANSLPSNFTYHMDNDKSGATLAWDYFSRDKPLIQDEERRAAMERLYAHIQDVDLWTYKIEGSKEFKVGLGVRGIEFDIEKNPSLFLQLQHFEVDKLIENGKKEMGSTMAVIHSDLEKTFPIYLGGKDSGLGSCLAVFTIHPQFRSDMGHLLAEKSIASGLRGIGAICYVAEDQKDVLSPEVYKVSLRSIDEEDTSVISRQFGGGGHRNASSFNLPVHVWQSWCIPQV